MSKVNSICILGGGTSGFCIASLLSRYRELSGLDFDITVVHNEKSGSLAVGESTLLGINQLFSYLGVRDSEWMKKCNATYKTAIRFEDFYKKGSYFYYPFGWMESPNHNPQFIRDWFIMKDYHPESCTSEKAAHYFLPSAVLADKNKLPDEGFDIENNTAYHFDSLLIGKFLKEYAEEKGVVVVNDNFYGTEQDKYGNIESIVCDNGTYRSDLFVDCTGFNSLLLGKTMSEEYISFSDTLINNKALVAKIPYTNKEEQLNNYTNCFAMDSGWCWEIPLWDKLSVGYVHTNRFATEKEIEEEFFEYLGEEVDYRTYNFKTGRYKRGWVKNVVAVGLSYGFLEPLESTGISTMLINSLRLLEFLSKRDMFYTQVDRDAFNYSVGNNIDGLKNFIESHYFLSSREDSDYWKYVTENITYDYDKFLDRVVTERSYYHSDSSSGTKYICAGMNYSPFSKAIILHEDEKNKSLRKHIDTKVDQFEEYVKDLEKQAEDLPSTHQFLLSTIYAD